MKCISRHELSSLRESASMVAPSNHPYEEFSSSPWHATSVKSNENNAVGWKFRQANDGDGYDL